MLPGLGGGHSDAHVLGHSDHQGKKQEAGAGIPGEMDVTLWLHSFCLNDSTLPCSSKTATDKVHANGWARANNTLLMDTEI